MTRYIALLRGVNVGGVRIPMATLRQIGLDAGFDAVSTHLNSGNLLFDAADGSAARHAATISSAIETAIGRHIPVIIRTPAQLTAALDTAQRHFGDRDERRVAIAFLDRAVTASGASDERLGVWASEEYVIDGTEIYLHYPDGQADTKLTMALIEKRLEVIGTARGIKTVAGLIAKS